MHNMTYYDSNCKSYSERTFNLDMSEIYDEFLCHIAAGGLILDAGCGSGRDSLAFKNLGFNVIAIDASGNMARIAEKNIGQSVYVLKMQELRSVNLFDGIWSCASFLHVPQHHSIPVMLNFARALKNNGVIYISVRHGTRERTDELGRFFCDYTIESFCEIVSSITEYNLRIIKFWESSGILDGETWLNFLIRKQDEQ